MLAIVVVSSVVTSVTSENNCVVTTLQHLDDAETGSKIASVTPTSYETEDFPVDLIVTHIAGDESRRSIADEENKRVLLDSWTVQMNQVCRWSELRNDRNVEIDGISRLKVYKDAFSFEFSVLELGKKAQ